MIDSPQEKFTAASRAVLAHLQHRFSLGIWMVTETTDNDWTILYTEGDGYDITEGSVLNWSDSICYRMLQGLGPQYAACVSDLPAYAAAPVCSQLSIDAYIGVPLSRQDGTLFGTLCGIDKNPQPKLGNEQLSVLKLFANLLCLTLEDNTKPDVIPGAVSLPHLALYQDRLTGLLNKNAWNFAIAEEEVRLRRYGGDVSVFIIELKANYFTDDVFIHPNDESQIQKLAFYLCNRLRQSDIVARVEENVIVVLARDCDLDSAAQLETLLEVDMMRNRITACIGKATRNTYGTIGDAIKQADENLVANKKQTFLRH